MKLNPPKNPYNIPPCDQVRITTADVNKAFRELERFDWQVFCFGSNKAVVKASTGFCDIVLVKNHIFLIEVKLYDDYVKKPEQYQLLANGNNNVLIANENNYRSIVDYVCRPDVNVLIKLITDKKKYLTDYERRLEKRNNKIKTL